MKKVIDFKDICSKNDKELQSQYRIVGAGSSRVVFDIHQKYVLKKARASIRGKLQTAQEISLFRDVGDSNRLCPIIYSSDDAIVAAKTIPANTPYNELPNDIIRNKFKRFRKLLSDIEMVWTYKDRDKETIKESLKNNVPNYKSIMRTKIYQDIEDLVNSYDVSSGDLWRTCNWGYYHGYFVIIDYGLTEYIGRQCYW